MNGVEEPSIAKRLRGTPERIELENYHRSVKRAEELEEVPEETQAEHNLSSVLDKGTEEDVASRSACAPGLPSHWVPRAVAPPEPPSYHLGGGQPGSLLNMKSKPNCLGENLASSTFHLWNLRQVR
jgi:hypothetical protein